MKKLFAAIVLVASSFCAYPVVSAEARPPDGLVVITNEDSAFADLLAENEDALSKVSEIGNAVVELAQKTQNQDEALYKRFVNASGIVNYAGFLRQQAEWDALVSDLPDAVAKVKKSTKLLKVALSQFEAILAELKKTEKNDA